MSDDAARWGLNGVAELMTNRCRHYKQAPPQSDWDGATDMTK
ncbi:MAG: hypothetical protein AAFO62_00515 [Pseudomonadota bacterium]